MKKFILTLILSVSTLVAATAQIYSPSYAYYQGVGYFVMSNGYYYGNISGGYPQGEGYCYCIDPQLGFIYYHGNFDKGVVHGKGELLSSSGYICGTWNHGDFISQIDVPSYQMQQSYTDVWSNYFNYYAPTYSYPTYTTPNYDYTTYFNQSYYPTYTYPTIHIHRIVIPHTPIRVTIIRHTTLTSALHQQPLTIKRRTMSRFPATPKSRR